MQVVAQPTECARFDCFEANLATGELRKHGIRIKLHDQPFQILAMLIARPGEMVTREEIQQKLWPAGTFVDFENGMNRAVNRLRDALGDSADEPKFIETIPRRGYRFLVPVERPGSQVLSLAEPKGVPRPRFLTLRRWIAVGLAAVFIAAALVGWRLRPAPKKAVNFGPRDWVLITNFENRTDNPVLDGTMEYALARELSNSEYVNVVPRERADDALRLMLKPLDTKIDPSVGREICLRDGSIHAMLTGRVEKFGTVYMLSAQLVDPVRGVAVASFSEEDSADSQMVAAVRRLSNRVRETLGETRALIQQSNEKLEKVTTPSLRALQLYSQADALMQLPEDKLGVAAEVLKQALVEDPNFASAHLLLGYTLANRNREAEAKPEFLRALELSNSTPDRERLFIVASYQDIYEGNKPKAIEAYEALLQLYPDHFWASTNLSTLYIQVGRWEDSWKLLDHLADLRPDALRPNRVAACGKYLSNDPEGAKPYVERARAIAVARVDDPPGLDVNMLPIFYSWTQGDVAKARSQFMQLNSRNVNNVFFLWSLGELSEGERRTQGITNDFDKSYFLAMGAYLKGDLPEAKKHFQELEIRYGYGGWTWFVVMGRSGLWDKVEDYMQKNGMQKIPPTSPGIEIVRGELAIAHNQLKKGTVLLEKGLEGMQTFPVGAFYLGSETLARTHEKDGNLDAALRVLRRASDAKGKAFNCLSGGQMNGAYWLRDELQLADLYRKMGHIPEAERVEDELRKMLIYADADHPIVLALEKRERLSAAANVKR